jgi:lysyl endopeptidase
LETLQSENVILDPYTFAVNAENVVSVTISMPNGVEDENPEGSTLNASIPGSPESGYIAEVEILTDGYGDETYWEIRNSAGDVLSWGGNPNVGTDNIGTGTFPPPYSPDSYGNNEQVSVMVEIPETDCYTFHITDFYGDGLLDDGYYQVNDFEGNMIIQEDDLSDEEMNDFAGEEALSVEELNISDFSIYPNPANEMAHMAMNLLEANTVIIEVVNLLGKVVYSEEMGNLPAGNHLFNVDVASFRTGLYLFNIYIGTQKVTERVSVN